MFNEKAQYFSAEFKEQAQAAISKRRPELMEAFDRMDGTTWVAGSRFHSNEQVFHVLIDELVMEFGMNGDKFTAESVKVIESFLKGNDNHHLDGFAKNALLKAAHEDCRHLQSSW